MGPSKRRLPLKRVGGEVRLASVNLESSQPSIEDIPLRRCSNETDINCATDTTPPFHTFHQYYQRSFANKSAELGANFTKSISSSQFKTAQRSRQRYLSHTLLNSRGSAQAINGNLVVPNNSVATSPPPAANKCQTLPHSLANSTEGSIETRLVEKFHHHNRPRRNELPFTRNALNDDECCSSIGPTLSKFASTQVTYQPTSVDPLDVKAGAASPIEEISTATTLDLPGSNRDLLSSGGPSAWSMTLQHPKSPILSETIVDRKVALASSRTTTTVDSSGGGGDNARSPPTKIKKAENSTPQEIREPPPSSAATSTSDKPTFMLTFRKPKPRPRSIITNRGGRSSLPTTASTPNSQLPVEGITNDGDENNNAEQVPLLPILEDVENNNNNVQQSDEKDDTLKGCKKSNYKLPNYVFDMRKGATSKNQVTALPAGLEDPEPEQSEFPATEPTTAGAEEEAEVEVIAMAEVSKRSLGRDESFWRSDSTTKEETAHSDPTSPANSKSTPASSRRKSKLTKQSSSSPTSQTTSKSVESTYPKSSYGYKPKSSYHTTYNRSDAPVLTTEKGAIRFHLPGRIQHKTTIKVAHFPIADEKNVILNVKPDKEDDDDLPCGPICANNQNFSIPPCPPPYSSYPYSYPYPNYYDYYGYPPYC